MRKQICVAWSRPAISVLLAVATIWLAVCNLHAQETSLAGDPAYRSNEVIESTISFKVGGSKVVGTLSVPSGMTSAPVILILHGFTPKRDGIPVKHTREGMFSRPARLWAERGFASLRISTRGAGGSDGNFEDMTIESRIEEAKAAISWLSGQSNLDHSRIGIVGYNQGAIVATATAGRMGRGQQIKSIALWMPITNPIFYYANRSGLAQLTKGLNARGDETVALRTRSHKLRAMKHGFYKDVWTISPAAEIVPFKGNMLVVMGTRERADVPVDLAENLLRYHSGEHKLIALDTNQGIGVFEGSRIIDDLAMRTLSWFSNNL